MFNTLQKSQIKFLNNKIQGHHQDRLAIVYIRQSTLQQVEKHSESTKLQYGLVEKAYALGWSTDRVIVIDEDLGRSGSNAEGRPGFQRLVAEVGLDRVGLVLGIEMSRLARSCRDWHQFLNLVFQNLKLDGEKLLVDMHEPFSIITGCKEHPGSWRWRESNTVESDFCFKLVWML